MQHYPKIHRLFSLVLLVCFMTTVSGIPAVAGHDCCGNCRPTASQHPQHTAPETVSGHCCQEKPACTCTLQSDSGMALPVYSLVQVNTVSDNPSAGPAAVFRDDPATDVRLSAFPHRLKIRPPGSRPIYLTHRSILC